MTTTPTDQDLHAAVRRLGLHGVLARWEEIRHAEWLPLLVDYEQTERQHRSLERRLRFARLGRFKPLCDFDWQWPKKIDRMAIEELGALEFLAEAANVVLIGPNGTGKTMIAQHLAHRALLDGHRVRFTTASATLTAPAAHAYAAALQRRLRHYCRPSLLVVDELGYLSICLLYTSDAADDLLCVDLGGRRIIKKK